MQFVKMRPFFVCCCWRLFFFLAFSAFFFCWSIVSFSVSTVGSYINNGVGQVSMDQCALSSSYIRLFYSSGNYRDFSSPDVVNTENSTAGPFFFFFYTNSQRRRYSHDRLRIHIKNKKSFRTQVHRLLHSIVFDLTIFVFAPPPPPPFVFIISLNDKKTVWDEKLCVCVCNPCLHGTHTIAVNVRKKC